MGGAKNWAMEQDARGFSYIDGDICADCLSDEFLKRYVTENATEKMCSYCQKVSKKNIATALDDVMQEIMGGITLDWSHPDDEGIAYEGGYQASLTDTHELISDYNITENELVFDAIVESISNDAWVECDFYRGSSNQRLMWGWEEFCRVIIYDRRYLFLHKHAEMEDDEITPAIFLYVLAEYISRFSDDLILIKKIEPAANIYRARIGKEHFNTAHDLGAPKPEDAIFSNRMSPAGIPMFYGAFDKDTAHQETFDPKKHETGDKVSIGIFQSVRPLYFLNLGELPEIPSVFDSRKRQIIPPLRFLHDFAKDISKPIERDSLEHRDYVPTQVVTEFFRHIYKTIDGRKLDGIIYSSSKNKGGSSCVIFCENHQACDQNQPVSGRTMLQLTKVEHNLIA